MAFTYTWDASFEASPADSDFVSQGAGKIRDLKKAISERLKISMSFAGDANDGKLLAAAVRTALPDVIELAATTEMLFAQTAAPSGWTKQTSLNDRVIRVVSGSGGGTGGSWTLSGISVNNKTLAISNMPVHNHSSQARTGVSIQASGAATGNKYANDGTVTGNAGSGVAHNHGLTIGSSWRPAYYDVIRCRKD